ncbi:amidase family protein [Gluconacetobacter johannae]|uniref:Amidase n=1 Tax=Gluconacetobacter johannae TaxID=112140 RepID=A0A7W4J575_9PROT|nr:amidase family protein [Gluconacetobacter johannae]MBB2174844.1 amidase [Gluconacetobacter johannae]
MSCEQRVREILARLARDEPATRNVFHVLYADTALAEARASDQRRTQQRPLGALDGRIVSVKDLFDVAGSATIAGSRLLEGVTSPASADAPAVARLRAAGCVVIGRTTMSELAFSGVGINPHYGTPGNPVDPLRIPGGSSSGAAVSVAAGLADIALGSDTGGSLRIPAALCGMTGFRPTSGWIPTQGAFPLSVTLDTVGPIASDVSGCRDAFAVLSGSAPLPGQDPTSLAGRKIGVSGDARLMSEMDDTVSAAFARSCGILRDAGAEVMEVDLGPVLDILARIDAIGLFPGIELAARLGPLTEDERGKLDPMIWDRVRVGYDVQATDYLKMHWTRMSAIERMDELMAGLDAIVLPTVPVVAPMRDALRDPDAFRRANGLLLRNTRVANMLDLPTLSLPMPGPGLPSGLMLWGRKERDWPLLALAGAIEAALGQSEVPGA